jgi:hypothetical protein
VGDTVISRVNCFITGTALFFGTISAFANSTAFNGYVQSSGNTGIDLSSLDGGNYRVTVTRSGHLNFRYVVGGQTFDSNPDAAILDMRSKSYGDAYWSGDQSPAYTAYNTTPEAPVFAGAPSAYTTAFGLFNRQQQAQEQAQLSSGDDLAGVHAASGSVSYYDEITGSNFYVPPQSPGAWQVPSNSLVAFAGGNNSDYFFTNDNPTFSFQEVPEPAALALIAGGLLLGAVIRRRVVV